MAHENDKYTHKLTHASQIEQLATGAAVALQQAQQALKHHRLVMYVKKDFRQHLFQLATMIPENQHAIIEWNKQDKETRGCPPGHS